MGGGAALGAAKSAGGEEGGKKKPVRACGPCKVKPVHSDTSISKYDWY